MAIAKASPTAVSTTVRPRGRPDDVREPDVAIEAPAVRDSVPLVRDLVVQTCRSLGVAQGLLDDVALAVTEACSNSALHAYPAQPGQGGALRVSVTVREDEVTVVVEDDGRGVEVVSEAGSGAGLGLGIIGSVTDAADLGPAYEGRGTSVRMAFART
jgi:serine/threonine-protein kinase RsbW